MVSAFLATPGAWNDVVRTSWLPLRPSWTVESLFRLFFFFQAEDGIRDSSVTGVQTCALPISKPPDAFERIGKVQIQRALVVSPLRLGGHFPEKIPETGIGEYRPVGHRLQLSVLANARR